MNAGVFLLAMLPALALLLTVWVSDPDKGPKLLFALRLTWLLAKADAKRAFNSGRTTGRLVRQALKVPADARPFVLKMVSCLTVTSSSFPRSTTLSGTSGTTP
jgi:hypothetical protein